MTKREAAIVSAYTGILIGKFDDMKEYIEEILERSIFTHELAHNEIVEEIKEKSKEDFLSIIITETDQKIANHLQSSDSKELLRKAVTKYGIEKQVDMAIEEMSELTKSLLKMRRKSYPENTVGWKKLSDDIIEEMADVQIMLEQLKIMYGDSTNEEIEKMKKLAKKLDD